jgi:hypothetical protein
MRAATISMRARPRLPARSPAREQPAHMPTRADPTSAVLVAAASIAAHPQLAAVEMREIFNIGGMTQAEAPVLMIEDGVDSAAATTDSGRAMVMETSKRPYDEDPKIFYKHIEYVPRHRDAAAPADSVLC